jgi:hypothetical protein
LVVNFEFYFVQRYCTKVAPWYVIGAILWGSLTIRSPTKRPRDNLTHAQFTPGPPPASANKRFMVAGGGLGCWRRFASTRPLRVDRNAETEKKWTGGWNVSGRNVKGQCVRGYWQPSGKFFMGCQRVLANLWQSPGEYWQLLQTTHTVYDYPPEQLSEDFR